MRTLLDRWVGKSQPMDYEAQIAEDRDKLQKFAQEQAQFHWGQARSEDRQRRYLGRLERRWGVTQIPPPMSEMAFVNQITSRKRARREEAALMLRGRQLSNTAAPVLVWQLRHRNADYRMSALKALRGSTISSELAAIVLAAQLEHPKPELREVAEQVRRETKIAGKALKYIREDVE